MHNVANRTLFTLSLFAAIASATPADADPVSMIGTVVDQEFDPVPYPGRLNVYGGLGWAQTFTVDRAGTLAGVDVLISAVENVREPLWFDLRRTHSAAPVDGDGQVLATVSVPPSAVSASMSFLNVDLGAFAIPVGAGDQFAVVLRSFGPLVNGPHYEWASGGSCPACGDPAYTRGALYFRLNDAAAWSKWAGDATFRTFVRADANAAPTPEPATLVLIATGLAYTARRFAPRRRGR